MHIRSQLSNHVVQWRIAVVLMGVTALVVAVLGQPLLWWVGTTVLLAIGLSKNRTVVSAIPLAALLPLAYLCFIPFVTAFLQLPYITSRPAVLAILAVFTLASTIWAWVRCTNKPTFASATSTVATSVGAVFAAAGVWLCTGPVQNWAGWLYKANDSVTHLVLVSEVRHAGFLSYQTSSSTFGDTFYPRGLHAAAAQLLTVAHLSTPEQQLHYVGQMLPLLVWGLYAAGVCAAGLVAARCAKLLGAPPSVYRASAVVASIMVLGAATFTYNLTNGYYTSAVILTVCMVFVWELFHSSTAPVRTAILLAVLVAVAGNVWQLAAPVLTLAAVPALFIALRACTSTWRKIMLGTLFIILLFVGWWPVGVAYLAAGTSLGTAAGGTTHLEMFPVVLVGLGSVGLTVWAVVKKIPARYPLVVAGLIGPTYALFAVGLLVRHPELELSSYYPDKIVHSALFLATPAAVGFFTAGSVGLYKLLQARAVPALLTAGLCAIVGVFLAALIFEGGVLTKLGPGAQPWGASVYLSASAPEASKAESVWNVRDSVVQFNKVHDLEEQLDLFTGAAADALSAKLLEWYHVDIPNFSIDDYSKRSDLPVAAPLFASNQACVLLRKMNSPIQVLTPTPSDFSKQPCLKTLHTTPIPAPTNTGSAGR